MVVVDYAARPDAWNDITFSWKTDASQIDYASLIALPELSKITKRDLRRWFNKVDVPDTPVGRREELIQNALKSPLGTEDGTPLHIFGRLRKERLWTEEKRL